MKVQMQKSGKFIVLAKWKIAFKEGFFEKAQKLGNYFKGRYTGNRHLKTQEIQIPTNN